MSNKSEGNAPSVARKTRTPEVVQEALFDLGPDWREHWWGMPAFVQGDARPTQRITMNFMTWDDVAEFGRRLGIRVTRATDTAWFPQESIDKPSEWEYSDES